MAYDEGLEALLAGDLADEPGITRQRMFGGVAILRHGHMVCGVHSGGAMFRVGKAAVAEALTVPGTHPMEMGGRVMGGMVGADDEAMAEDASRARLMALALVHARGLPPKT